MPTRHDARSRRALGFAALVLLSILSLGLITTSQTLWSDPPVAVPRGL